MRVTAWGNAQASPLVPLHGRDFSVCAETAPGLPHGAGRSYGDVCLNPGGMLWGMGAMDRFVAFDGQTGVLTCEPGVRLGEVQRMMIPRGWMLPVTPGTQAVTVGGAVANDVHGKNHVTAGSFGHHVLRLRLQRTDGSVIDCDAQTHADWFAATIGGMGLTGIITQVTLQLRPVRNNGMRLEQIPFATVEEYVALRDASSDWEYCAAWMDYPRGIFMRAVHVESYAGKPPRGWEVPLRLPVVNRVTVPMFNALYYRRAAKNPQVVHYAEVLYPLDKVGHWNRLYGAGGVLQYQVAVPKAMLQELLRSMHALGLRSWLTVVKEFGVYLPVGMMSFAREGMTVSIDLANNDRTLGMLQELDARVRELGGWLYPAKDARMAPEMFAASYPQLEAFLHYRDPGIRSGLSQRLMGW